VSLEQKQNNDAFFRIDGAWAGTSKQSFCNRTGVSYDEFNYWVKGFLTPRRKSPLPEKRLAYKILQLP